MKNPAFRWAVVALALASACEAHAMDSDWYVGLGVGYAKAELYTTDFSVGLPQVTETKKEFDSGYKLFLGHRVNRNWAIEGQYVMLGKFQYTYTDSATPANATLSYRVTGFAVSALPTIPLGERASLYGRLGVFFSQSRLTVANNSGLLVAPEGTHSDTSQSSPLAGIGMQLNLNEDSSIRIEYENYGKVGCSFSSCSVGRANMQMLSVNAIFGF